jgi:hypothetical protein
VGYFEFGDFGSDSGPKPSVAFTKWVSTGIPDGAKLTGPAP